MGNINVNRINWEQIRTPQDVMDLGKDVLFDYSGMEEPGCHLKIREGLTDFQQKDAEFWKKRAHGIMLITSNPGQGKSLLQHMLAFKMKYYFDRTVILDHKPREPFGFYIPFSTNMLVEQMERMYEISQIDSNALSNQRDGIMESSKGQVFLHNSVIVLEDLVNYMPRANHNLPIARTLGDLFTIWRHLGICMIGSATKKKDLNRFRCFPEVTSEVYCERHPRYKIDKRYKDIFLYWVTPLKWNEDMQIFEKTGKTERLFINGAKKRQMLNGNNWYGLYNSWNVVGLRAPKSLRGKGK